MTFSELASGDGIFFDANIFVYHFGGTSAQCRELMKACESGKIRGYTGAFVVSDTIHKTMLGEAVARGLISPGKAVQKLKARPEIVRSLDLPKKCLPELKAFDIQIVSLDTDLLESAARIQAQDGLLTGDSLILAAMRKLGLTKLATNDRDFLNVKNVDVYVPTDVIIG